MDHGVETAPVRTAHRRAELVIAHVCFEEVVSGVAEVPPGVLGGAGAEVVDTQHRVAALEQQVDQVRPDEPGPTGDEHVRHQLRPTPS